MEKKEVKSLIKEFEKAHSDYSSQCWGHWKKNWERELKFAALIDGYWYWKDYRIADLKKNYDKKSQ